MGDRAKPGDQGSGPGPGAPTGAVGDQWLALDGQPVAPLEVATSTLARARGLLGRHGLQGALLIRPAASIHTVGMRFAIDVALCRRHGVDGALTVATIRTLAPGRVTRPRPRARTVIEAEAGAFERWGLVPGAHLTVVDRRALR